MSQDILSDDEVELTGKVSYARYPKRFRHVVAKVPDSKGVEIPVSFLSNNMARFQTLLHLDERGTLGETLSKSYC